MKQLLKDRTHPEWLTLGCMVLLGKDSQKRTIPSNYWPIACLCMTLKLLSGIIIEDKDE